MIDERRVQNNKVSVGNTFASYAALCRAIGIAATKGKQRQGEQDTLKRYFDWKKLPNSNRIIITKTFYNNPKPKPESNRTGKPLSASGVMLQELVLARRWNETTTRTAMLAKMGLIPKTGYNPDLAISKNVQVDYHNKMRELLEGVLNKLAKKEDCSIRKFTCFVKSKQELTPAEESAYRQIKAEALEYAGESKVYYVYLHNKENQYYGYISDKCIERFDDECRDMICITTPKPDKDVKPSKEALVDEVINNLAERQNSKVRIGKNKWVTSYCDELLRLKSVILNNNI